MQIARRGFDPQHAKRTHMQTAPHSHDLNMPSPRSILIMSALCLNMFLVACDKNEPAQQTETPKSFDVIPQHLVAVQSRNAVQKPASPGTIRAVNPWRIQAQVSA